jgi:hypothetical protein
MAVSQRREQASYLMNQIENSPITQVQKEYLKNQLNQTFKTKTDKDILESQQVKQAMMQ